MLFYISSDAPAALHRVPQDCCMHQERPEMLLDLVLYLP
uniref:GSVIVT00000680001 n=1 Tax=Arundo donax TaxID=35708 RepID=A0A0A9F250_ARUDO